MPDGTRRFAAFSAAAIASLRANPRKNPLLGPKAIWRAAVHDLRGTKDVQDAATMSYTWLADQFGHFGLGFALTVAGSALIHGIFGLGLTDAALIAGLAVVVWFGCKEWRDYQDERAHAWSVREARPQPFAFNGGEIVHNCLCACFYTFSGVAIVVIGTWRWWAAAAALAVLFAINLRVAYWWLQRKVAFQQADLPYLYRLTNFPENLDHPAGEEIIGELVCAAEPRQRHVLVSGPLGSGKSSLAVGIGTEYAFRLGIARFTSLIKLSQRGVAIADNQGIEPRRERPMKPPSALAPDTTFNDGRALWRFHEVEMLIIDDLDGGVAGSHPLDPAAVLQALQTAPGPKFFAQMAQRRTLWVAGIADRAPAWRNVVAQLVTNGDIDAVALLPLREDIAKAVGRRPRA